MFSSIVFTHHKANRETHGHPPNTMEALRHCLDAGVDWVEIDVRALKQADFVLLHDEDFSSETVGSGSPSQASVDDVKSLSMKLNEGYFVFLLSQVVFLCNDYTNKTRLQIDLKDVYPYPSDEPLQRLATLLKPLGERVQVSCAADWQLRRLKKLAPWLSTGFDIQFHVDFRLPGVDYDPRQPPYREGAYGFHDDSLLSLAQIWPVERYLEDRCMTLMHQVPGISTIYAPFPMLMRSLELGFNWAEATHAHGLELAAWTLDVDSELARQAAPILLKAGVDRFISNTPIGLRKLLEDQTSTS